LQARALPRHGLSHARGTFAASVRLAGVDIVGWIFEQVPFLASLGDSEWLLGLAFLALTATLIALGVPGVLVPLAFSSGALLGGWLGMAVVVAGALIGSHAFFVATRKWLAARVRTRWGERLHRFDREIGRRGFFYVAGLRVAGVPHFLVTAASALSPIRARSFALATLLGFLPAIALAAMAGSVV
jgi:uncharacterized membrane protein YdjX (TVP38/TMEM64 family)